MQNQKHLNNTMRKKSFNFLLSMKNSQVSIINQNFQE